MKHIKKTFLAVFTAVMMLCICLFAACENIAVKGDLVLNQDGTGSRKITATIIKHDKDDGYGNAYYYLRKHGSELQSYIEGVYQTKVSGSEEWLAVKVTDGTDKETIELSYNFTSFADYTEKLGKLVKFGNEETAYTAPTLVENSNGSVTYSEPASIQTAIYKALQTYMMDDETVFDIDCTINGEPANKNQELGGGMASDYNGLLNGVEDDKEAPMSIKIGAGNAKTVTKDGDNNYVVTANYDGSPVTDKKPTELVLDYSFNDTLNNAGTLGEAGNLTLGAGSQQSAPAYVDGIDGKGYYFDGSSYLASANRTFSYDELTVSFYYRMDEYVTTDTGANMVIVPAGLGALGAGVIDLEFINEADTDVDGVQFLVKMNSTDWQTQDKLYTETTVALGEWHCYTIVFQNTYADDGYVDGAYVNLYIDGERVERTELSFAAGLKYSLGMADDTATANGGFNLGGYFEADLVKRTCKGVLDNFKVFDGALSASEVKSKCYTVEVNNGGTEKPGETPKKGCGSAVAGSVLASCVVLAAVASICVVVSKRKNNNNAR